MSHVSLFSAYLLLKTLRFSSSREQFFSSFQIDFNVRRTVDELSGGLFGEEKEMEEVENVNLPLREEEPRV